MEKKRSLEEQIIRILKDGDTVGNMLEMCRQQSVSEQIFHLWRKKYSRKMDSDFRKLRELEKENAKLKKIVAELTLDKQMFQNILSRWW